jgi:hypothetical protein
MYPVRPFSVAVKIRSEIPVGLQLGGPSEELAFARRITLTFPFPYESWIL